jgi:putative integral membrane protein (TIGR02587 family)
MSTVRNRRRRRKNQWIREINDIIRGACGGFLFGIPLLYTMEVWWVGSFANPPVLLMAIAATFVVVFLLNQTEGFRSTGHSQRYEALTDTVEAMAIGLVCSTLVLLLLRELTPDVALVEALGKITFEGVPFTLGVALANNFLGDSRDHQLNQQSNHATDKKKKKGESAELNETLSDIGATLIGALVIAFNIAPTDEVAMLAAAISEPWLLLLIVVSLLISYGIVFEAGFSDQQKRRQQKGIFQRPLSETIASYLVSLTAAGLMLWFFQRLTPHDPWTTWLEYALILGLPATIGGAAGRLAV